MDPTKFRHGVRQNSDRLFRHGCNLYRIRLKYSRLYFRLPAQPTLFWKHVLSVTISFPFMATRGFIFTQHSLRGGARQHGAKWAYQIFAKKQKKPSTNHLTPILNKFAS
jgi:hypothetical protein